MEREIVKEPKVALCRKCNGTGKVFTSSIGLTICPQCQGSGRVVVSCKMKLEIKPYQPTFKKEHPIIF